MSTSTFLRSAALGAAAGVGATFLLQAMMKATPKLIPRSEPPMRQDAGEFMIDKVLDHLPDAARNRIPPAIRQAAAKSLHLGYGITPGILYALARRGGGSALLEGTLLGLGVWAAGYLGWLPATGLMPPVTEQQPRQVAIPIVRHALFGIALVTAYTAMASRAGK